MLSMVSQIVASHFQFRSPQALTLLCPFLEVSGDCSLSLRGVAELLSENIKPFFPRWHHLLKTTVLKRKGNTVDTLGF